jgi:hypothetical protein
MKNQTIGTLLLAFCLAYSVSAQTADPKQAMAQIKTNLETSAKNLATYTWVETTTVMKGDEIKSQTQNQCSVGPDGKVKKVPLTAPAPQESPRGVRGKIVENKKEELGDHIKRSVAKVQEYLPPNPEKLQAIYAKGQTSIKVVEANKKYTLEFPEYLQPGDKVSITLELQKGLFDGIEVLTTVDNPQDKIVFNLIYSVLADGTEYPSETRLNLPGEGINISIKNDKHQKVGM